MLQRKQVFILLVVLLFLTLSPAQRGKGYKHAPAFRLPVLPAELTAPSERASYLFLNCIFWNDSSYFS